MPDRRLSPAARRAHLLDTAVRLAAGGDLLAVSVADIAAAADVSEGLLYHYFPSKQALLEAAVQRAADQLLADLTTAVLAPAAGSDPSPLGRLSAALDAYLDRVQADPTGWRALLAATSGEPARIAAELDAATVGLLCHALGVDKPGPGLRLLQAGWLALERAACLSWLDNPALGRDAVRELLLAVFGSSLAALAPHDEQLRGVIDRLGGAPG
ncbi:MAG TPA: TetR/AcrR family transcriptional regulator [Pseudonocardia sp.]|nr:TetR/AcrR family transcriptional regulator [Pseudonocardia sp.]